MQESSELSVSRPVIEGRIAVTMVALQFRLVCGCSVPRTSNSRSSSSDGKEEPRKEELWEDIFGLHE
jgi:hypothetical protein